MMRELPFMRKALELEKEEH